MVDAIDARLYLVRRIPDPLSGKTIRMFECKCGSRTWERVRPVAFTIPRSSCYFYPSVRSCIRSTERDGLGWPYILLKILPMGPEEIAALAEAYEHTLRKLNLVERSDPITQIIAKKIIEISQRGERNPQKLSELAIKELGVE